MVDDVVDEGAPQASQASPNGVPSALKAIVSGNPDLLATAKSLCDFNASMDVEFGRYCKGVEKATSGK